MESFSVIPEMTPVGSQQPLVPVLLRGMQASLTNTDAQLLATLKKSLISKVRQKARGCGVLEAWSPSPACGLPSSHLSTVGVCVRVWKDGSWA